MSWSDSDKIDFEQLNSELQGIINLKVDLDNFRSFTNEFDTHRKDHIVHMTLTDRHHFEHAYEQVNKYLEGSLDIAIDEMKENNEKFKSHVNNTVYHWTDTARNEYNKFVQDTNQRLEELSRQIDYTMETSDARYITNKEFSEEIITLNNHIINKISHVTEADRQTWNSIYDNATEYTDSEIYKHETNEVIHIKESERRLWNQHMDNETLHVTTEEKGRYDNHVNSDSIHVTMQQKIKWENYNDKINDIDERVTINSNYIQGMLSRINSLETRLIALEIRS